MESEMSRIYQRRFGLDGVCGWDAVFEDKGFFLQVWPTGHEGFNIVDIGYSKPVSMVEIYASVPDVIVAAFFSSPVIDLLREHKRARDRTSEVDWREGMPSGLWG